MSTSDMGNDLSELPSFETVTYRVILAARNFSVDWRRHKPEIEIEMQRPVSEALERLENGMLFSFVDYVAWLAIEQALVNALNTYQAGYGGLCSSRRHPL